MHISSIKLRGFKSFKKAEIELPHDFICLAGPNGSGKTNVLDAVRFALGEKSLKSLRARKVKDLICHSSKYAEVVLNFQDEKKYELRRAIKEDGKVRYMLNGKNSTRTSIMELLKRYNLDASGRNIIAQGEVQRVVEISGRERRGIIDAVAGIADFEAKKKEALKELEVVEGRMRDANLVLGERKAFLHELEAEKESALKYSSATETMRRAKATLIRIELNSAEKKKAKLQDSLSEAKKEIEKIQEGMGKLDEELKAEEEKKAKVSAEIGAKEEREKLLRELEKTKAEIASKKEALQESAEALQKLLSSIASLEKEIEAEKKVLETLSEEEKELRKQLVPLENLRLEHRESAEVSALRKSLEGLEDERTRIREQAIILRGEVEKSQSLIEEKKRILEDSGGAEVAAGESLQSEIGEIRKKLTSTIEAQDRLFSREKELNAENAGLDRELLTLREKVATLRAQTAAHIRNPALQYINELKESGQLQGVHGTVAELIEFKPEYSKAIDAAGGSRLLYIVVDSADVAVKAISHLKKAGRGRATFLPLKEVSSPQVTAKGGMGPLVDFVSFKPQHAAAVNFVFGNTLLVTDAKEAKKLGIAKERMVTTDGDLFEKSGIITGGKTRGGVASAAQLSKMEGELDAVKSRKAGIIDDLSAIREEMSSLRREKAETEIQLKKKEVESDSLQEKLEEHKKRERRVGEIREEIRKLEKSVELSSSKHEAYQKKIQEMDSQIQDSETKLREAIEHESSRLESMEKEREDKSKLYSSLRAKADSKRREFEVRTDGLKDRSARLERTLTEKKGQEERISQLSSQAKRKEESLSMIEERLGKSNAAIKKLMKQMGDFEQKLQELGEKKGKLRLEFSKHEKTLTVAEVELQNIDTRLTDLQAEYDEYKEVEPLEGNKEQLTQMMRSAESAISELGAVNLAAPEMYEEKSREVKEMQEKIEKLRVEKEAVIEMISGIEERKKEAFFETFHEVDKQFRKLFTLINIGEGHLYMDKPSTPFESGLYIKVRRNDRDHSLESLSGGEKSLVALMFVFALQFYKPSPFYVLDEVDAPLDKVNTKNLAKLLTELAPQSQFLVVSHNDIMMGMASAVLGVSRVDGASKIVGVKLEREGAPEAPAA